MTERKPVWRGYARVSTVDQNPQLQIDALSEFIERQGGDPEMVWVEKKSGRSMARPILKTLIAVSVPGDKIVVWKLDRLGRTTVGILETVEFLAERGVDLVVVTQGFDTGSPVGKLILTILAAVAQMESDLISERTKAGIAAQKAKGHRSGRLPIFESRVRMVAELEKLHAAGGLEEMADKEVVAALWHADSGKGKPKRIPDIRTYRSWKERGYPGAVLKKEPLPDPDAK